MAEKMKVLVYWTLENNWSIVSTAAVRGEAMPGTRTFAKFQGKWYPAIPITKSDNQKALNRAENSFRQFINSTLAEEDPDDIEDKILEYVNAKDSVSNNGDMGQPQDNSRMQARVTKHKDITDKALQQQAALKTGKKLLEKVRCSQQKVSTPESDESGTDSHDVRGPSTSTPDEDEMSPLKKVKTDIPETSGVQFVTFDQLEDILERYVKKSEFRRFRKRFDSQEPANDTEKEVEKIITEQKGAFEAVEAGLKHFFTIEEIRNHSATGKKANKDHVVKPKFDPAKFNLISKLVQKHFDITHKEVVIKTQNVKRKYSK